MSASTIATFVKSEMRREPDFTPPPTPGIKFDWSFNLGHVGCVISVVVSVTLAYSSLKGKTDLHDIQISDVKGTVEKVDDKVTKLTDKVNDGNILLHELAVTVKSEGAKIRAGQQQP